MEKIRLDQWLVAHGLAPSRARAVALIEAGVILVNGAKCLKSSRMIGPEETVASVGEDHGFVGRGALKLEALLDVSGADLHGGEVVDIGASTGGFCECCLRRGAARVYAVDVGQGQLHPRLRDDPRVVNLEKTDARELAGKGIVADTLVMDVSFISLLKVLPAVVEAVPGIQRVFLLVKPQFEVGPAHIGKGGLVKDDAARLAAIERVRAGVEALGFDIAHGLDCPVVGGDGNREYLLHAVRA